MLCLWGRQGVVYLKEGELSGATCAVLSGVSQKTLLGYSHFPLAWSHVAGTDIQLGPSALPVHQVI